jgi:hypothetical protein
MPNVGAPPRESVTPVAAPIVEPVPEPARPSRRRRNPKTFVAWLSMITHDPAIKAYRTFVSALGGIGAAGATVSAATEVSAGQAYGFGWKAIAATTLVDFLRNVGEELGKQLRSRPQ